MESRRIFCSWLSWTPTSFGQLANDLKDLKRGAITTFCIQQSSSEPLRVKIGSLLTHLMWRQKDSENWLFKRRSLNGQMLKSLWWWDLCQRWTCHRGNIGSPWGSPWKCPWTPGRRARPSGQRLHVPRRGGSQLLAGSIRESLHRGADMHTLGWEETRTHWVREGKQRHKKTNQVQGCIQ